MSAKIVQLNEKIIKGQIKELVRGSVAETLNELLEAEAEKLTQAARYERRRAASGLREKARRSASRRNTKFFDGLCLDVCSGDSKPRKDS